MVYLDYNASAPMPAAVIDAMAAAAQCGNPSSVHGYGRRARALIEASRDEVAALVGAEPERIIFTSGATEANALALRGCRRDRVLVSATEHVSVLEAVTEPTVIQVDSDGSVSVERFVEALGDDGSGTVAAVMMANNETGVLQSIQALAAAAAETGALLHCDAAQAPGRVPLDFTLLGADTMSLSAHKFGGPKGVGALVVKPGVTLTPERRGGGQERGMRGGTENLTGIAGFGAAARLARKALGAADDIAARRDRLEAGLRAARPDAVIFGAAAPRLPNTSCIGLPGVAAETQVMSLDLAGVAVSAGSACSSGKMETSHVLLAMGVLPELADCAIRVSHGPETRDDDIEHFLAAWTRLARKARRSAA